MHQVCAHLAAPRLREVVDDVDLLRRRERPDHLAHLQRELLRERGLVVAVVVELAVKMRMVSVSVRGMGDGCGDVRLERDEGVDGLAGQLVCCADDCDATRAG
jgi:hypothetical protein